AQVLCGLEESDRAGVQGLARARRGRRELKELIPQRAVALRIGLADAAPHRTEKEERVPGELAVFHAKTFEFVEHERSRRLDLDERGDRGKAPRLRPLGRCEDR